VFDAHAELGDFLLIAADVGLHIDLQAWCFNILVDVYDFLEAWYS